MASKSTNITALILARFTYHILICIVQIAAEAAEAAAKKVRNEMQEKLDMMEQVPKTLHCGVTLVKLILLVLNPKPCRGGG